MKKTVKEQRYPLLQDFVFKRVFGDRKNTGKLAALLSSVLPLDGDELASLKIENTFVDRTWKHEKLVILDVLAGTKSGRVFDVEVQVERPGFFRSRLLYYLSRLVTEQLRRGRGYDKIRPAYCIAICGFDAMPELSGYVHHVTLREEKTGALFTDIANLVIIELPKMPARDDGSRAWPVFECFRCRTGEEAEMLAKAYPVVRDILDDLKNFSLSKEIRAAYNLHMKAVYEYESYKSEYFRQGQEEGAAREREKWESEFEALRSEREALLSKFEALKRELERLRAEHDPKK